MLQNILASYEQGSDRESGEQCCSKRLPTDIKDVPEQEPHSYQGTAPFPSKNPPVGPSAGKVAKVTGSVAPC